AASGMPVGYNAPDGTGSSPPGPEAGSARMSSGPFLPDPGLERGGLNGAHRVERFRHAAHASADQSPRGSGASPGETSKLLESLGPRTDRPALAREGRSGRPGARDLSGSPSPFSVLSGTDRGGVCRVAAANPGRSAGQAGAALCGNQGARRAPGTEPGA